jgi:membrane protein implicated in regulation of membrane protease activity
VVDIVSAIVVAGVVLLLVLSNPSLDTLVVGGGAILVLLYGQIRSRRFRQKELRSLTGSTEQMLDQSIERVRAGLSRARSTLILLPPAFLLGILVAYVAVPRSGGDLAERFAQPGVSTAIQIAAFLALAAAVVHILRTIRVARRELERLTALRDAYRQEGESGVPE